MNKLKAFVKKYREPLAYLFFGGVTTVVNIGIYAALHTVMGMASDPANVIAWVVAVMIAYITNRIWVFRSHASGTALLKEFAAFIGARLLTGLMDFGIMHVAVEILGSRLIPDVWRRLWDIGVKIASNVLVIILNYVFSKSFIFKRGKL